MRRSLLALVVVSSLVLATAPFVPILGLPLFGYLIAAVTWRRRLTTFSWICWIMPTSRKWTLRMYTDPS